MGVYRPVARRRPQVASLFCGAVVVARSPAGGEVVAYPPFGSVTAGKYPFTRYTAPPLSCAAFFFKVQETGSYLPVKKHLLKCSLIDG